MRGEIINFAFDIIKSGKIRAYGLQLRNWEKPNWFPCEVLCENFAVILRNQLLEIVAKHRRDNI